ncbi:hypothetical protein ACIOWE_11975 [Pseudomonas sp. NPDC087598]|uniref:hypothetical protein n=1 Tax=Pseudomonas sp. NPDC087598 TaxID=3364440 RepID=UPI00380E9FFB
MSPKPPARGVTSVDVHTRPNEPTTGAVRRQIDSPAAHALRTAQRSDSTLADVDLEAITAAPAVTISQPLSTSEVVNPATQQPLRHYWVSSEALLPHADATGFRTFKGRRYGNVSEGGVVHIVSEPETGRYRAKLPSELLPSGPILSYDLGSQLWRPLADFAPVTYPLPVSRLQGFRTDLDFTGVEPGPGKLHRHQGKLYVVIEEHTYQVLHDQDASSPQTPVKRIVRPEDAVARDEQNLYVATRPGRSEPIVHDAVDGWVGILVGGISGMPRTRTSNIASTAVASLELRLKTDTEAINQAVVDSRQLETEWREAKGKEGERGATVAMEVQIRRLMLLLDDSASFYLNQREALAMVKTSTVYKKELLERQIAQVAAYTRLMFVRDARHMQELRTPVDILEAYRTAASYLANKLALMEKRQQIASDALKSSPSSQSELTEVGFDPTDIHAVTARWIDARSRLLTEVPMGTDFVPAKLAIAFSEATTAFQAIERMPDDARIAVLSTLLDQCAAIRAAYERFSLPPDPAHVNSRNEITQAIRAFENTLEERLARYHQDLERIMALPIHDQPIDFDFIPAQDRTGVTPPPKRVFRARHHGHFKICIGQSRRTPAGDEVIDVMSADNPAQTLRTYERKEGEWQKIVTTQDKTLGALMTEADESLAAIEAQLASARQDERAKETASNILDRLGAKAEELDELRVQIEQSPNPLATDVEPLIQRLRENSQRLRSEGENIRVRLYKDKTVLSADRVAYLISHGHLSVKRTHNRVARGKGEQKEFLSIYSVYDRQTGDPLWHVHFHYEKQDSPALNFKVKGGHLKTLAQSRSGVTSQRLDELAGRPHVRIWRETIDGRTAQKIFDLAD